MRRATAVALMIGVSGCAAVHHFSDATERENAAANFRARWVGKSEADVVRRYGSPAQTAAAPASGHRILTYRAPGGDDGGSCDLQFEVDDPTSIVVRAVIAGKGCRGDL